MLVVKRGIPAMATPVKRSEEIKVILKFKFLETVKGASILSLFLSARIL
jgi:hypothetical protein